jgi:uncharacterized membrane protein
MSQHAPHLSLEPNPALVQHAHERGQSLQNRLADRITAFSGSMAFVYIHLAWFGCWIGFGVERYPYGLLTMIVSLEAIFLSTFVLISQNRADAKRQALADQQWQTVQEEDRQNEELLDLSRQILDLTKAIHAMAAQLEPAAARDRSPGTSEPAARSTTKTPPR